MRRTYFLLFFSHLLTRLIFINMIGLYNNYSLQCDSIWLVKLANESMNGNFNFDIGRFIASPLFPILCGLFKTIFLIDWQFYLILFQVLLSVISGLYIYKIAFLLFNDRKISLFTSLIFALFPLTLWFVNTFSQESIFESLLIITIYYLLASFKHNHKSDTVKAAILFSLTYLTKSHILLFSLFIPLLYYHFYRLSWKTFMHAFIFTSIVIVFSLPFGMYNYYVNDTYVLSSNGAGYQFYLGNTEAGYITIVNVPEKGSVEFEKMEDICRNAGDLNGSETKYNYILNQPQNIKQKVFYKEAIIWIKSNPMKFVILKLYDAVFFLFPGVSFRHYSFFKWITSFLVCAPIYILAYISIYRRCRNNFSKHAWILYLFFSMLIFSIVWYVQNRFRTITLEPFYIIYASVYLYQLLKNCSYGKNMIVFLDFMFLRYLQSIQIKKIIFGT